MRKNKIKNIKFKYLLILFSITLLILQFVTIPLIADKFKEIVTPNKTITQQR